MCLKQNRKKFECFQWSIGTPDWDRTSDNLIKSQVLYQLSYGRIAGQNLCRRQHGINGNLTGGAGYFKLDQYRQFGKSRDTHLRKYPGDLPGLPVAGFASNPDSELNYAKSPA